MWIRGLNALQKPFVHLHTQFNRDLPWNSIDMDFMNLNQSAHGDREAGFIHTRMRLARKVVVGHWADPEVHERIGAWMRAARAWHDWQGAKFCRFGDNMRQVAVTEGDKVAAEMKFGFATNGYGVGELASAVGAVSDAEAKDLAGEYEERYRVVPELRRGGERHESLLYGARLELGLRSFLGEGGFKGFTTTFEDLHGLKQLPGLAPQRLMADGYGFGAEGDWKTAALVRAMKVMAEGLPGGTSFMEDYTYDLPPDGGLVLGAHMLEVCPSIAADKPSLEIHRLTIGGKEDPVRLVFDAPPGPALERNADRSGRALPPARERSHCGRAPGAAEAAGRARGLAMQARFQDGLRRLDFGRRSASYGLQLRRERRNAGGFRHDRGYRIRQNRRGNRLFPRSSRNCATTTSITTWRTGLPGLKLPRTS